jgi:hypothetical protein
MKFWPRGDMAFQNKARRHGMRNDGPRRVDRLCQPRLRAFAGSMQSRGVDGKKGRVRMVGEMDQVIAACTRSVETA